MKTKEEVRILLENKPHLRDSDNKLIATYWYNELKKMAIDTNNISAMKFLKMFADSALTNVKTIERMRRKLQEECPELRGKMYKARKETIQDQWKRDLGYEVNK
jgi:hypothetical protein